MGFKGYCEKLMKNDVIASKVRYRDVFYSTTAVKNYMSNDTKDEEVWENIRILAPIVDEVNSLLYPCRMNITSWFRSMKLNAKITKNTKSNHLKGFAVDFVTADTESDYKRLVKELSKYTRLILEKSKTSVWIHLEYNGKNERINFELKI
jgi:hypothetical protein